MNDARPSDGLLPKRGFVRAFELAALGVDRQQLVAALRASQSAPLNRSLNTLDLMVEIGVLCLDEYGRLSPAPDLDGEGNPSSFIAQSLLKFYLGLLRSVLPTGIFQLEASGESLKVNPAQLPARDRCYPYALLEFGIFSRGGATDEFWSVSQWCMRPIMELIRAANIVEPKHRFSLALLKASQLAREAAGRLAENWVVDWERRRLRSHPFVELVRCISDENAAAGFDIMSFDSARGPIHDRFIEVKGYGEEHSFYWSEGEIDAARRLGMRYWLYLVDRNSLLAEGYQPEMIQDPVSYFIDREPVGWAVAPTSLKFTRVGT
jgi:hypothetical protein